MIGSRHTAVLLVIAALAASGAGWSQGYPPYLPNSQPPGPVRGPQSYPTFSGVPRPPAPMPSAQAQYQQPNTARPQICTRLEGQLAALDQGGGFDPGRAAQIRQYEDAAGRQQYELDRVIAQSRQLGCEGGGFFSLFRGQNPQCVPLTRQVQQMRGNLDGILASLERLRAGSADRDGQRRAILISLGQNDCGQQYRSAANRGGFLDALMGPGTVVAPQGQDAPQAQSSTFRTLCVRTCDGYYFPISFATTPARFGEDERTCQRMCPASEVNLYAHRNPGEDVNQAVSLTGRPYTELPAAFHYRQQINNKACSCRRPGQSWSDALKQGDDTTLERGDIVVTEERAKQLSRPQGKPSRPDTKASAPGAVNGDGKPAAQQDAGADTGPRKVRSVGPAFYSAR